MNKQVQQFNEERRSRGEISKKGRRMPFTPKRLFPDPGAVKISKGHGIDAFLYKDKIALPLLYPFVEQVQRRNPNKPVWLIEDNAPAYTKAAKMLEEERSARGIQKVDWPANSPDLHFIESLWHPLKERLRPHWRDISGGSKEAKISGRRAIWDEWNSPANEALASRISAGWLTKLKTCSRHNGKNNFRG